MKYIKVSCVNEACSASIHVTTIPEGRYAAPGVIEKYGDLICEECRHVMYTEAVK